MEPIDLFSSNPQQTNWLQARRLCPDFKMPTITDYTTNPPTTIGTTMTVNVYQKQYPADPDNLIFPDNLSFQESFLFFKT